MGFLLFSGATTLHAQAPKAPAQPVQPSYTVTLTAYNAVPEQTDDTPHETASGAFSNPDIVAARSRDLAGELPFGTIVAFDGTGISPDNSCGYGVVEPRIGYRVIADTMNARYADRIDILFDTKRTYRAASGEVKNAAEVLGVCNGATLRVVGYVDIQDIPETQAELAVLVGDTTTDLALK
ncbi:hypothetical protein HY415_02850 [Candidatus Kaiserbacteria bacterium]|nr:hypothetical protein [Candidatus Kaiserbacteria bacterium]